MRSVRIFPSNLRATFHPAPYSRDALDLHSSHLDRNGSTRTVSRHQKKTSPTHSPAHAVADMGARALTRAKTEIALNWPAFC